MIDPDLNCEAKNKQTTILVCLSSSACEVEDTMYKRAERMRGMLEESVKVVAQYQKKAEEGQN